MRLPISLPILRYACVLLFWRYHNLLVENLHFSSFYPPDSHVKLSQGGGSMKVNVKRTRDPELPLTSSWPQLRCGVGLEEGEYRENCLCATVVCTIIMVHKDMSSSYRSVDCIGL